MQFCTRIFAQEENIASQLYLNTIRSAYCLCSDTEKLCKNMEINGIMYRIMEKACLQNHGRQEIITAVQEKDDYAGKFTDGTENRKQ